MKTTNDKARNTRNTTAPEAHYNFMTCQSGHNTQLLGDDYRLLQWRNGRQQLGPLGGVAAGGGVVF